MLNFSYLCVLAPEKTIVENREFFKLSKEDPKIEQNAQKLYAYFTRMNFKPGFYNNHIFIFYREVWTSSSQIYVADY